MASWKGPSAGLESPRVKSGEFRLISVKCVSNVPRWRGVGRWAIPLFCCEVDNGEVLSSQLILLMQRRRCVRRKTWHEVESRL